jgi:site-specific DNA-methyltransferase (adenine-specific)
LALNPYYEHNGIVIYNGDCRDILPSLKPVDVVVTDPPYGCGKADWDDTFPLQWYALARPLAEMIVIITGSSGLKDSIGLVGDDFIDVIAARNMNGMTRGPLGFGNWLAAVVAKGKPPQGINCFDFVVSAEKPNHPSPKPFPYMRALLSRLGGGTFIDPFMGSGTTLLAAKDLGCTAIGVDLNESYCEMAAKRLSQEVFSFM